MWCCCRTIGLINTRNFAYNGVMKKSIAVIFGGKSPEHDVSIITSHIPIIEALETTGQYDIWPIYIAKTGVWYSSPAFMDLGYFQQPNFESKLIKLKPIDLGIGNGLEIVWPGLKSRRVKIDLVFPALHGTYGEDGSLMGLLRLANVPFVGCDIDASVIAMDKVLAKQVAATANVPSVPYIWFNASDYAKNAATIIKQVETLQYPLFVKPVHLGSSIAITKVERKGQLVDAIEVALHYDTKVIIEQGVKNLTEITLPIMGNDELTLALIEQPLAGFFTFEEKYLKGGKKGGSVNSQFSHIPAPLPTAVAKRVNELGQATYKAIGASGIARVDFLIDNDDNQVYMNEINTLPGSLYHHNWRKAGVSSVELVEHLITLAEERFASKCETTSTFSSTVLKQVSGPKTQA